MANEKMDQVLFLVAFLNMKVKVCIGIYMKYIEKLMLLMILQTLSIVYNSWINLLYIYYIHCHIYNLL